MSTQSRLADKSTRAGLRLALGSALLLAAASGAWGATYVWNGSVSSSWATTTNWTPNGTPGAGDTIQIDGTATSYNLTLAAPETVANVDFNYNSAGIATLNLNGFTLTVTTTVNFGQSGNSSAPACTAVITGNGTANSKILATNVDTNEYQTNLVTLSGDVYISMVTNFWLNQNNGTFTTFTGDGLSTINIPNTVTVSNPPQAIFNDVILEINGVGYTLSTTGTPGPGQTVTVSITGPAGTQYQYLATYLGAAGDSYQLTDSAGDNVAITATTAKTNCGALSTASPFTFTLVYPSSLSAGHGLDLVFYVSGVTLPLGSITYMASASNPVWVGGISSNWSLPANWSSGAVPVAGDVVTIPSGTAHSPVLTGNAAAGSISVSSGAILDLAGFNIASTTSVINDGTIRLQGTETIAGTLTNGSPSTVDYYGTGTPIWGPSYSNLTIEATGSVTASTAITVAGSLSNSGTLNMGSGHVLSFASYTGNGSDIVATTSGTVTATGTGGTIAALNVTTGATINGGANGLAVTGAVTGNLDIDRSGSA